MNSHNLYLLSHILRDGLLTRKFNQAIAAMFGMSGCCEKVIELFALVCFLSTPSFDFINIQYLCCHSCRPPVTTV